MMISMIMMMMIMMIIIFLFFVCVPRLYLWGLPFWVNFFFAYVTVFYSNY